MKIGQLNLPHGRIMAAATLVIVSLLQATALWAWNSAAPGGKAIFGAGSAPSAPGIVSDGAHGAFIVSGSSQANNAGLLSTRINADGNTNAAWGSGLKLPVTGNLQNAKSISDGDGGVIVVWEDNRNNPPPDPVTGEQTSNFDIVAQRYDAKGEPQWGANGKVVCSAPGDQSFPELVSDGDGGAIIVWYDSRNQDANGYDIYAQRIDDDGNAKWTADGVAVATAIGQQYNPELIADGDGGAIIVWQDERNDTSLIYAQRIDESGSRKWAGDGIAVAASATASQAFPKVTAADAESAIVVWQDERNPDETTDIYAQKLDLDGNRLWAADVPVSTYNNDQINPQLVSDGAGGAIIAWEDYGEMVVVGNELMSAASIFAQRIAANGTRLWRLDGIPVADAPADTPDEYPQFEGIPVSDAPNDQLNIQMAADGAGGAILVWEDYRSGSGTAAIYAQWINSRGIGYWTTAADGSIGQGIPVAELGDTRNPRIIADDVEGPGGAIIVWEDYRDIEGAIYAQRLNNTGALSSFNTPSFDVEFNAGAYGKVKGSEYQTILSGGSTSAVTAVPKTGYRFENWTGNNGFVTTTANPLTVANVTASQDVEANFVFDPNFVITSIAPVPGTYASTTISVTLSTTTGAVIYYTVDNSDPRSSATKKLYTGPIGVSADTTIKYYGYDKASNFTEAVKTATYLMHVADLTASIKINDGATHTSNPNVTLTLNAYDPLGVVAMQFSTDGMTYSAEEPYATTKTLTLPAGDGIKTVYIKFRDGSGGGGALYGPYTAQITMGTVAPVTTITPIPGTYGSGPLDVTLATTPGASVYYTVDGSDPRTSATRVLYNGTFSILATTTINYAAVDQANNTEAVQTAVFTIDTAGTPGTPGTPGSGTTPTAKINDGAWYVKNATVTLTLNGPAGVTAMQFSTDGTTYTLDEPYTTTKSLTLPAGDGIKTVYVKFKDGAGLAYGPYTAHTVLDAVAPLTTISPVAGTYASSPLNVTITGEFGATIYYTTDDSDPTVSTTRQAYTGPIAIAATTNLKYTSVDVAGNYDVVQTAAYSTHVPDLTASIKINGGAAYTRNADVTLTLNAFDPAGVTAMQFSTDGINYTAEEPYATSKTLTLPTGDGVKTVYVKFRDGALGGGVLYDAFTAQITLDTAPPAAVIAPLPGTYSAPKVDVTLATEPGVTVYYTTDGSNPGTSTTAQPYTGPIPVAENTTLNYTAVDQANNTGAVQTSSYTLQGTSPAAVLINGGALFTGNKDVTLALNSSNPASISKMQFSNDGINYSAEEAFTASKLWSLAATEEGWKTVYARFRDAGGNLLPPVTVSILFGSKDGKYPGTNSYLASALRALQITSGLLVVDTLDLVHCDVAPYSEGKANADGKIDLLDVYALLLRQAQLINTF